MGKRSTEDRFWAKVTKTDKCWAWTAAKINGYGRFWVDGRPIPAHRFAYELAGGEVPDGMFLDHTCHQPACVRPDHLRPATRKQNNEYRQGPSRNNVNSGARGVYRSSNGKAWQVKIGHNGRQLTFGTYSTVAEAEQVAIRERAKLFSFPEAVAS